MVQAPDLPRLEPWRPASDEATEDLHLLGALVEHEDGEPVRAGRVRIRESELHGVALDAENTPGLELVDVVFDRCDLSNVDGRQGLIRRVAIARSRLVGFGLSEGKARDLRVEDSSLKLASFALAGLQNVVFERVNLSEASFMEARMEAVEFIDCELAGADFRQAKLRGCFIRGSSLQGVLGVQSLRGVRMPWADLIGSVGALAEAVGIVVEPDEAAR